MKAAAEAVTKAGVEAATGAAAATAETYRIAVIDATE
jgi:hypothetical protein